MKVLNNSEVSLVSGGYHNDGYNFSFVVENTFVGALMGLTFSVVTQHPKSHLVGVGIGGGVGALYAGIMMLAKAADHHYFSDEASDWYPVETETVLYS